MIAQYGERRRKGVVMIPEGANGEGWKSVLQVFQAVVASFVARDKAKRQTVNERNKRRMTYAEIIANSQTSENANQRMLQQNERTNKVGDNEGHDIYLSRAEIMTRAQELKGTLDELLRLVGSGPEMEPMKLVRYRKCGVELDEDQTGEIHVPGLTHKELSSITEHEKQGGDEYCDSQERMEAGYHKNDNRVDFVGVNRNEVDMGIAAEREVEPLSKEGEFSMVNLEKLTMNIVKENNATHSTSRITNTYNRRTKDMGRWCQERRKRQ